MPRGVEIGRKQPTAPVRSKGREAMGRTKFVMGHACRAGLAGFAAVTLPAKALAQYAPFLQTDTALVRPAIPEGFDRGRNVAVNEQPRPDFDPVGIPIASFNAYPRLDVALGGTDNVYLTNNGRTSDGFLSIDPTLRLQSDWSRNKLVIDGGADIQRYFKQSPRNQAAWSIGANGEYDIGDSIAIIPEADVARQFESPYSGDTQSTVAVLSNYLTSFLSLKGQYQAGRIRTILAVDRTTLDFSSLNLDGAPPQSQDYRNRKITRVSGQAEYALSPTFSTYVQLNYDNVTYLTALPGPLPSRSSKGFRVNTGINFDLAGFLRGTLGIGYVRRNYDSALYKSVDGLSVEGKIEYFASDLTTITLRLRRFLEDSSVGSSSAYFDNRVTLSVDHALLQNLLLNASASYGHVKYIGQADARDNYFVSAGAVYMATRRYGLKGTVSYGKQTAGQLVDGQQFKEFRGQLGFYIQD
jgi:hypothetical protein